MSLTEVRPFRNCGNSSSAGSVAENVIVAVKAEREISRTALAWALTHVVRPGDCITLVVVLSGENRGRRYWKFPKFARDCASGDREITPERMFQISESCSQMMLQFHGAYQNKINVRIKVVSPTPVGVVAAESKRAAANWVVLDKQLKQEKRRCMEELQCNIVVMKGSEAKVLRLNLVGPLELDYPYSSSPDEKLREDRIKHSTPVSSPEETKTCFTRTTEASVSSFDIDNSPFLVSERNPLFEGKRSFIEEDVDSEDAATTFGSNSDGFSPSSSDPLLDSAQQRQRAHNHQVLWIPQNHIDGHDQIIRDCNTKPPTARTLFEKFAQFDLEARRQYLKPHRTHHKNYVFNSDVREAVSLYRHSPSIPPPLCSICRHKAPVFGKPPRWFGYTELIDATDGFSQKNFLAEGGFGLVHKGVLRDGQVVAVKQLKIASSQGDPEFCAEVEVLSCAQHRNVVMLVGFCIEGKKRILVYEYICNGSLGFHLYGHSRVPLDWHARIKIAVGAARGLRYLHEDCRVGCIIHRDMRPNNILITHDFEPLVGDFGLARWQPDGELGVETRVIGTFGYLAPEYAESGKVTEKADVYAFGVVLLELITGAKAVDVGRPKGKQLLVEWARPLLEALEQGRTIAIDWLLDRRLDPDQPPSLARQLWTITHAASLCLRRDPHSRPRMSQVLRLLEGGGEHGVVNSIFDIDSVGNRSERLRSLSPNVLAEQGRSRSARLSHEALKAIYTEKEGPVALTRTGRSFFS